MSLIVDHSIWVLLGSWCSHCDCYWLCNARLGDVIAGARGSTETKMTVWHSRQIDVGYTIWDKWALLKMNYFVYLIVLHGPLPKFNREHQAFFLFFSDLWDLGKLRQWIFYNTADVFRSNIQGQGDRKGNYLFFKSLVKRFEWQPRTTEGICDGQMNRNEREWELLNCTFFSFFFCGNNHDKSMHAVKWIIMMKETESLLEFIFSLPFRQTKSTAVTLSTEEKRKKKKRKRYIYWKAAVAWYKKKALKATKIK